MAAKHYESSMDSVESPSSSFLCFPRRSIRPAPKEPSTKDLRRRDRDASGIYHFGPVSGPEGSSSSGPKELPAATIRRNSTRTGRIVKEGHDYLRNASDLVFQHRKSLGPQVHDFDSRWAELYNVAPVLKKLTKGRQRPVEFRDNAQTLFTDVQEALRIAHERMSAAQSNDVIPSYPPGSIRSVARSVGRRLSRIIDLVRDPPSYRYGRSTRPDLPPINGNYDPRPRDTEERPRGMYDVPEGFSVPAQILPTRTRQKFQSFYRYPPAESLKAWNSPAIADKSLAHEPEYSSRPRRRRRYESENHSYQPIRHDSPPRMPEAVVPPPPAPTGPAYVPQHRSEDEPHRYHHHHSRSTRESSERRHEPRRRRRRSRSPPPPPSRRERHESDSRARDRDRPSSRRHRDASVQRSVTMPSGRTISNPVMIQSTSRFKEMFT